MTIQLKIDLLQERGTGLTKGRILEVEVRRRDGFLVFDYAGKLVNVWLHECEVL